MMSIRALMLATAVFLCAGVQAAQHDGGAKVDLNIDAQPLADALNKFANQTGLQVLVNTDEVPATKLTAARVVGNYTAEAALARLLANTALRYEFINAKTVRISAASPAASPPSTGTSRRTSGEAMRLVRAEGGWVDDRKTAQAKDKQNAESSETVRENAEGVPEILVRGARTLNTDIRRTEDAPQPYVVFDSEEIIKSQALTLSDFLRTRLPMNTAAGNYSPGSSSTLSTNSLNLRGLGTNQTLILVDGRRLAGVGMTGNLLQPDLNGIPLSAVDRIEVLPSTAGGIYGGSATGGVVNIILRHDYQGVETRLNYTNTFDTDSTNMQLEASAGFAFEGGRTRLMVSAARSSANILVVGDRDFAQKSFSLQLRNNPASILNASTPPQGRTVNIRSNSGNLRLDAAYGGTLLNSNITHIPLGYAGPSSDNAAALIANAGRYNLELPNDMNGLQRGLMGSPSMESFSVNLRREFSSHVEAFLDLGQLGNIGSSAQAGIQNSTVLAANAPNNPFQQAISVRFPTPNQSFESSSKATTRRATAGVIVRLPGNWTGELDYGWSHSDVDSRSVAFALDFYADTAFSTGLPGLPGRPALNVLQEGNTFPIDFGPYLMPTPNSFIEGDNTLKDATLRFSGPVLQLPGGPLTLATLIEQRKERVADTFYESISPFERVSEYAYYPHRSQDADSYQLEARAAVVSQRNRLPLVNALELQASIRRDKYRTQGVTEDPLVESPDGPFPDLEFPVNELQSTDYTLGLRYSPVEDLALRASYGTGFLPPSVIQVAPAQFVGSFAFGPDPRRGNTSSFVGLPVTYLYGGNPDLKPEMSRSQSLGLILTPRVAPGLRISVDYTKVRKTDEIQSPDFQLILNTPELQGRIVRGPNLSTDQPGWAGPIVSFDGRDINVAKTELEAYDFQIDYTLDGGSYGEFHVYTLTTWQPHFKNQRLPTVPVIDTASFSNGPLEWRGNAGLGWQKGPMSVDWNAQYYNSYYVYSTSATVTQAATLTRNQGSAIIPRQIYHDLIFTYRFDRASQWLGGILADSDFSFGVQNLFNREPPILASSNLFTPGFSQYGDPRLRRYSIGLRKNFGL